MTHATLLETQLMEQQGAATVSRSKAGTWTGRILSGLAVLFLLMDSVMKFWMPSPVIEGTARVGWPVSLIPVLGIVLLACTILYVVPRTAIVGAVLLTGYLGGAVATHLRIQDPLFSHVLFPTYLGVLLWAGLYLRDRRLRTVLRAT